MQLTVQSVAASATLVVGSIVAVVPAVQAVSGIHIPAVQLTAGETAVDTPSDLWNTAFTDLTDASGLLRQLDLSSYPNIGNLLALQDTSLANLDILQSSEDAISAHTGILSSLVEELVVTPVNQDWADAGEAMLVADQAFVDAIASGSGLDAAELGLVEPAFQLVGANLSAGLVDIISLFFGNDWSNLVP